MPDTDSLIGTKEAAEITGDSVRTFIRRIGKDIEPALKLEGKRGAYLFERAQVEALVTA